jgi:protein-disulfide isomerase
MARFSSPVFISIALSAIAAAFSGVALLIATGLVDIGQRPAPNGQALIRERLLENPEMIVEAMERLQERERAAEADELKAMVQEHADAIFTSPASPVLGNPEGDVTLVEFFDYNCPYCRQAAPMLTEATGADANLRLVFKEWPILGPGSDDAARVALAVARHGKYEAFHEALMAQSGRVDKDTALSVAQELGLDVDQLEQDMADPEIAAEIDRNLELANALRITGTPTFIVGDEIIRGLVDLESLQRSIDDARGRTEN